MHRRLLNYLYRHARLQPERHPEPCQQTHNAEGMEWHEGAR